MSCCCGAGALGASPDAMKLGEWNWGPGTVTPLANGINAPTITGTATARGIANTNILTATRRQGYVSAAAINSVAGVRHATNAAFIAGVAAAGNGRFRGGGFRFLAQFAISDAVLNGEARMFVGINPSLAAPTAVDPLTLPNIIGVGCDTGETTLRVYATDAVPNATEINLGVNFPVNVSGVNAFYRLVIACAPGQGTGNVIYDVFVERLNEPISFSTRLQAASAQPLGGVSQSVQMWRSTGPVNAAAVGIDFGLMRLEHQL